MDKFKHVDTWVFDLDNTLYNAQDSTFIHVAQRMAEFISRQLNLPMEEAVRLRKEYLKKYGTSMRGLEVEHNINPNRYLDEVHDFDISNVPQCLITQEYLSHLPGKKIIFTNAPRPFATRMVKHLGIDHHFDHLFTIEDANFLPKPHIDPYHTIIKRFDFDPKLACMFEDTEANLKPAHELGMTTVWCHGAHQDPHEHNNHPHLHHRVEKLSDWLKHTIRKK